MQDVKQIDFDELVQKMHALCPDLPQDEDFNKELRTKLEIQIKDAVPKVQLQQLDLKYIILNVKKSLSDIQRRIDDSIAQQQLRRTARARKIISQDPTIAKPCNSKSFRNGSPSPKSASIKADTEPNCSNSKCCHQAESDVDGLLQVESLPVSASTSLVTIFIPSILQEKLHSRKYKISIDLNRLDLTTKILDLNVSELKKDDLNAIDAPTSDNQECKMTFEIKDDNDLQLVEQQTQSNGENSPRIEIKSSPNVTPPATPLQPVVSIIKEIEEVPKVKAKRAPKRKDPKPPSNEAPKKRGRKPGSKNKVKPEKSELARYVEMFECSGNSPSSALSQIVTSTTQNWDVLPEQTGQIAYFMNGAWTTLGAPVNSAAPTMVTTTNGPANIEDASGNETFIPFDDFVNFIDNPSLDIGNNVIARVLNGSVDTQDLTLTLPEHNSLNTGAQFNEPSKGDDIDKTTQLDTSTAKPNDNITKHSTHRDTNMVFNSSKENTSDVLDLTKKSIDNCNKSVPMVDRVCHSESSNVIFSTCRSMPSLDDEGVDLFCSTPQRDKSSDNNIIAFSMKPRTSLPSEKNNVFSPQEETISDSAIEVEKKEIFQSTSDSLEITNMFKTTSPSPSKAKDKEEVIKGMSLLEIEKDFDDTLLDFGNLDDDLLSLAPSSCFNSPLDDRFADSNFLDIEEPKPKTGTENSTSVTVPTPAPRSHLESGLLTSPEDESNSSMKNFKIPKMKSSSEISAPENSPKKILSVKLPLKPKDIANISTAGVLSPLSSTSPKPPSQNVSSNSNNITATNTQIMSPLEISKIFGSVCFRFLNDMCFDDTCKFSHQLLDQGIISISVSLLRNEVLHSAYRFIWRHYKLFKCYFPIFCEEYGRRKIRRKLSTMVRDCEMQPKCLQFLKNIYSALGVCGFSKVNACRFILSKVKDASHMAIDVLLEIILESDALMFAPAIERFSKVEGYKFSMKNINELATTCLRSGSAELVPALIKCLINVDQTEFLTMRSPDLIQLLEMIKNGGGM